MARPSLKIPPAQKAAADMQVARQIITRLHSDVKDNLEKKNQYKKYRRAASVPASVTLMRLKPL